MGARSADPREPLFSNYVQRAHSFTPRTGKYDTQTRPTKKKISQISLAR